MQTLRPIAVAASLGLIGAAAAEAQAAPDFPCINKPAALSPVIPGDTALSDQPSFNCFAWKEFIAVTWGTGPDASAATYGTPGDRAPVVFETYMNVHDLLHADGTPPPPWGDERARPDSAADAGRVLSRVAKLGNNFDPSKDINEASAPPAWLADRDGNLVWYEVLVNRAEYDYFAEHRLYNSERQYLAASSGRKIDLPTGTFGGAEGAMEFKAAWLTVTDPDAPRWARYKLSEGVFCTGIGTPQETCTTSVVALIGLHIIHKTASQPSWVWATFEHVDNVPDIAAAEAGTAGDGFSFWNPSCTPPEIPASCLAAGSSFDPASACAPNTQPAYALGPFVGGAVDPASACQPYPVQVARQFPLPDTDENPIVATNAAAQALIAAANPDSVFRHYQLVNVLWSDSPVDENAAGPVPMAPLSKTAFRPDLETFPVANPVLETYAQGTACLQCHSGAAIAPSLLTGAPGFASDYSFVFGMAGPDRPQE